MTIIPKCYSLKMTIIPQFYISQTAIIPILMELSNILDMRYFKISGVCRNYALYLLTSRYEEERGDLCACAGVSAEVSILQFL